MMISDDFDAASDWFNALRLNILNLVLYPDWYVDSMKSNEAIALQSLLITLSRLEATLPFDFQVKIHHLGNVLTLHQSQTIEAIDDLVCQHFQLHRLYELVRVTFQQKYQQQCGQQQCGQQQNDQQRSQISLTSDLPPEAEGALETMVDQVLSHADPQKAAQNCIEQIKIQQEHSPSSDSLQPIWRCLYGVVTLLEEQVNALLRAVERRPLTTENLSYVLQMSSDQVRVLVQYLWNAGYIDPTSVNVFRKIFPNLRRVQNVSREATQQLQMIDSPAYFTLTAKGFFHLHPLVTADRHEGISE
jgi:hypothetical protein